MSIIPPSFTGFERPRLVLTSTAATAQTYPTRAPRLGVPYATDAVKVPSFRSCNESASMDDEYFKTVMVLK